MAAEAWRIPRLIRNICTTRVLTVRKNSTVPPPIPSKLQNLLYAFRESKVLFAACDLGIFDIIQESDAPQSVADMSSKMGSDADATACFMDTLVALELLEKSKHGGSWLYSNSDTAKQFLTKSSPHSIYGYIRHSNKVIYPLFGNLESAVREGSNQWMRTFKISAEDLWKSSYNTEEDRVRFQSAMHSTSRHFCHAVVTAFDLRSFKSCCDLGGGLYLAYLNYWKFTFDSDRIVKTCAFVSHLELC